MRASAWPVASRRLALSFLALLLLPAAVIVWLGLGAIQDDRARFAAALQTSRDRALGQFAAALERAIAVTERQMISSADSLRVPDERSLLVAWRLDYPPEQTTGFKSGERLEYQDRDLRGAAAEYRALANSPRAELRAGALLRLAGTESKLGDIAGALESFRLLAQITAARVAGLPADLVARRARCALLSANNRDRELASEANRLDSDLMAAHWMIDPDTWRLYRTEIAAWRPAATAAASLEDRAALVDWLWKQASAPPAVASSGRAVIPRPGGALVALWHRSDEGFTAFIASPSTQQALWFDGASALLEDERVAFAINDAEGRPIWGRSEPAGVAGTARRSLADSGLPWTAILADRNPAGTDVEWPARRRLLTSGLILLVVVVAAGGYFVFRAVRRELAVATLQSDFVAAVSHEFRTPLTSMRQFTDLLSGPQEPDAGRRRVFYRAQARATDRLQRLVESLLDFGRMDAGAKYYQLTRLPAAALLRETTDEFSRDALPDGFRLSVADTDEVVHVNADRAAFGRALWNLLDNAVKYSGDGRSVATRIVHRDGRVEISVRDEGIGIPLAEQARVFERFFRGSASRSNGIAGTGIGLAMVQHIVEAHGGRLTVTSAPSSGSTFTISLPEA